MAFIAFRLYGFPFTFLASTKKIFNMVDSSAGSMFSNAVGIFLSFLHAEVGREWLVYFIVSKHSVLILYFIKWLKISLRSTNTEILLVMYQSIPSAIIPPPRATPGHLTPVRLHIVGHLTRIETRPIGHLTRRKNAGQRSHKLSECFIHSQNLLVYFASNSF